MTQKLESVWPSVSERLIAMLRRRGVSPHDADEAVQETAARAMSAEVEFSDADDLLRWASVVSWRIAIDARRKCTRLTSHEVPERADHVDVAQVAENRIVLSAVTTRFKELSERDRQVLLTSFQDGVSSNRLESLRLAAARHRARARLRRMLEGLAAPVLAFAGRRRWRAPSMQAMAATAPVLTCIAFVVTTMVGPSSTSVTASDVTPARNPVATSSVVPTTSVSAPVAAATISPPSAPVINRQSPANEPSGPTAAVEFEDPTGETTHIGTRPRRPDDHLACVTLPSTSGLVTTCVDPPVQVSP